MNNELVTEIVRKNKMYVERKTTPVTNIDHELINLRFKSYEKDVRFVIQEAKKSYFNRIFDTYKSDNKKTWLTINDTLSRNRIYEICHLFFITTVLRYHIHYMQR